MQLTDKFYSIIVELGNKSGTYMGKWLRDSGQELNTAESSWIGVNIFSKNDIHSSEIIFLKKLLINSI